LFAAESEMEFFLSIKDYADRGFAVDRRWRGVDTSDRWEMNKVPLNNVRNLDTGILNAVDVHR
jgi:hypothetical protein